MMSGALKRREEHATTRPQRMVRQSASAPGKRPLKVNVFENMLAHQGMLEQMPLFPYFGPGDIVPTAALSLSLARHAARRTSITTTTSPRSSSPWPATARMLATGQLYLQQGTHGVTTFLRKPEGPEAQSYQISLIIIRMKRRRRRTRASSCAAGVQRGRVPNGSRRLGGPEHAYYPGARQRPLLCRRRRRVQRRAARLPQVRRRAAALPAGADGLAALRAVRRARQPRPRQHRSGGSQEEATMALERKKTLNVFKDARERVGLVRRVPGRPPGHRSDAAPEPQPGAAAVLRASARGSGARSRWPGEARIRVSRDRAGAHAARARRHGVHPGAACRAGSCPTARTLQIRLKAEPPAREAVAWYCAACGALVHASELDDGIVQEAYWRAVAERSTATRRCAPARAVGGAPPRGARRHRLARRGRRDPQPTAEQRRMRALLVVAEDAGTNDRGGARAARLRRGARGAGGGGGSARCRGARRCRLGRAR